MIRAGDIVRGITTGATVWTVAGLGIVIGQGEYSIGSEMPVLSTGIAAILKEYKIRVQDLSGRRGGPDEPFELVFHVRLRNSQQAPEMLERVSQVPGVKDWSQISH